MVVISWGVGLPLILICVMSVDLDLYNKMKLGDSDGRRYECATELYI